VRQQAASFPEAAPASDVLPGEWMVPRPTAEVDAAVRQVLGARGMRVAEEDPEAGVVIPGTGGVRKLRWAARGKGKRGGARVIYFVRMRSGIIWMLNIYTKAVREDISARVLRRMREELEDGTP